MLILVQSQKLSLSKPVNPSSLSEAGVGCLYYWQEEKLEKYVMLITPLSAQISASNFYDLTQMTHLSNPKRTEKPKAHGFSVRFGLKHTLREVVVVLIANITLRRGVI